MRCYNMQKKGINLIKVTNAFKIIKIGDLFADFFLQKAHNTLGWGINLSAWDKTNFGAKQTA